MNIVGIKCRCSTEALSPDHYLRSECADPPMPFPWLMAILQRNLNDKTHRDNNLTVTRILGCPRATAIDDNLPNVVDLKHFNSPTWGTAIHEFMERHTPPGTFTEIVFPREGQEAPMVLGVKLRGTLDVLSGNTVVMEDYKCTSESSMRFRWNRKSTADPEVRAQCSLYKIIAEKCLPGTVIKEAVIWNGAMTSAKCVAPPWFKVPVDWMTEHEIGEMRPHGANYTVNELIAQHLQFQKELAEVTEPEGDARFDAVAKLIGKMPMVGRPMWNGAKCENYCASKETCYGIEGITTI